MKLRFRENSLRLRVNQREVEVLSNGHAISERIHFPDRSKLTYSLQSVRSGSPRVEFTGGVIRVEVPTSELQSWAATEAIGMYYNLPAD